MKTCSICKQPKAFSEFNLSRRRKDGLQTHCRACARERSKAYYQANREKHIAATRGRKILVRLENSNRLKDYLTRHPCADCGERDPVVLKLDRGEETGPASTITRMIGAGLSWATIHTSLEKFVVRCLNCARRHQESQKNAARGVLLEELQEPAM